jgi:hypothetical protein
MRRIATEALYLARRVRAEMRQIFRGNFNASLMQLVQSMRQIVHRLGGHSVGDEFIVDNRLFARTAAPISCRTCGSRSGLIWGPRLRVSVRPGQGIRGFSELVSLVREEHDCYQQACGDAPDLMLNNRSQVKRRHNPQNNSHIDGDDDPGLPGPWSDTGSLFRPKPSQPKHS